MVSDIASLFSISERTVCRYIELFRQKDNVEPQPREHGPKKLLGTRTTNITPSDTPASWYIPA